MIADLEIRRVGNVRVPRVVNPGRRAEGAGLYGKSGEISESRRLTNDTVLIKTKRLPISDLVKLVRSSIVADQAAIPMGAVQEVIVAGETRLGIRINPEIGAIVGKEIKDVVSERNVRRSPSGERFHLFSRHCCKRIVVNGNVVGQFSNMNGIYADLIPAAGRGLKGVIVDLGIGDGSAEIQ